MRQLVVLFALVAVAVAAPSASAPVEKRSIGHAAYSYGVPSAVSHHTRVDVHSSPEVVAAPVEYAVVSEPVVAARTVAIAPRTVAVAPAVYNGASAVSRQSYVDVHHSHPVVTSYAAPVQQVVAAPGVFETRSAYAPSVYSSYW